MNTILLASNNAHKLKEIRAILPDFRILSLSEAGLDIDPDETGATFYENALIKARAAFEASGLPSLADDSGLSVAALDGAPGVLSARYCGRHGADGETNALLREYLQNVADRRAKFVSAVVLYRGENDVVAAEGETVGEILFAPEGSGGFGYDPIFFSYDLHKSFGIASEQEKNAVSHRGRALRALVERLTQVQ